MGTEAAICAPWEHTCLACMWVLGQYWNKRLFSFLPCLQHPSHQGSWTKVQGAERTGYLWGPTLPSQNWGVVPSPFAFWATAGFSWAAAHLHTPSFCLSGAVLDDGEAGGPGGKPASSKWWSLTLSDRLRVLSPAGVLLYVSWSTPSYVCSLLIYVSLNLLIITPQISYSCVWIVLILYVLDFQKGVIAQLPWLIGWTIFCDWSTWLPSSLCDSDEQVALHHAGSLLNFFFQVTTPVTLQVSSWPACFSLWIFCFLFKPQYI